MEKNAVVFMSMINGQYKNILKFRVTENGGEFYDVIPGYGERYKEMLEKIGIDIKGTMIKPLENPKKFVELAPKFYSGTYEKWAWVKKS